jgi:hypothetical protein
MINGLDPTRVKVPPKMAENPTGMSRSEMGVLVCLLTRWMAGKNRAAAPMFCIKLEMTATAPEKSKMMRRRLEPAIRNNGLTPRLITPVWLRPWPIMITAMIEMTAVLDSPWKASRPSTSPSRGSATMIRMATTSTRNHSVTNNTTAARTTPRTKAICRVNSGAPIISSKHL